MGYDLYGAKNNSYFRASIWAWPSIMEFVERSNVLPPDVVEGMHYNDAQPVSEKEALTLADKIEEILENVGDSMEYISLAENPMSSMVTQLMGALQASGARIEPSVPMHSTNAAHVREFVEFCRQSGGFEVC
jgi:hypothetical protein